MRKTDFSVSPTRLGLYLRLVRADKPIGILLLLWPTLWSLWIASDGIPKWNLTVIFVAGTVLVRSAGCAMNDWADRDFDKHVERTKSRPLTTGQLSPREALMLALVLSLIAFCFIQPLNPLTKFLSVIAIIIAATYPFMKRFFAVPQAYLGIAYGFGIPMAFTAVQGRIPLTAWIMLIANVLWTIAYDTSYAMVDRDDDITIGIRTSAITFGRFDVAAIMLCYAGFLGLMAWVGVQIGLGWPYMAGLAAASICAMYHYMLIRDRERGQCFSAFLHNNWLGAFIFFGTATSYALS